MTVPSTASEISYATDGVTINFPIPFAFDTSADIKAILTDASGNVTAYASFSTTGGAGLTGTLNANTAPASGFTLTILDDPVRDQSTDYIDNDAFPAAAHERALDKLTREVKRLYQISLRSLRFTDGDPSTSGLLDIVANRKGKYLFFDAATGAVTYAVNLAVTTLTQTVIGGLLQPLTAREALATLVAADVNTAYPEGWLSRYNLVGDGATDDTATLAKAALASAQGIRLFGTPGKTYKTTASVTAGLAFDLDLQGATLKPTGNFRAIIRNAGGMASTVVATVSSGATRGSRSVVVASATSLAVGQIVLFSSADANYESSSWPSGVARITSIVGTTIKIDTPLPITYGTGGTISMLAYNVANFGSLFRIVGGTFDMSASTYTSAGAALSIAGYLKAQFDLSIVNCTQTNTGFTALQTVQCLDVHIDAYASGSHITGNVFDLQIGRQVTSSHLQIDGEGFGFNISRTDDVSMGNLIFRGRRTYETQEPLSTTSVRGFKLIGVARTQITNLNVTDYESGLKIQANTSGNIANIFAQNCGFGSTGTFAVNFSPFGTLSQDMGWNIANVRVLGSGGTGIGIFSPLGGKYLIANAHVKDCAAYGIYSEVEDLQVANAVIENWDNGAAGFQGIRQILGGSFSNVTFRNTDATRNCFNGSLTAGKTFSFVGIRRPDANPFSSAGDIESSGSSTIPNGAGTVNSAHGLIKTPTADMITLTPHMTNLPSTAPGEWFVQGTIGANFAVNCRNIQTNPNLFAFDWRARLPNTFTM